MSTKSSALEEVSVKNRQAFRRWLQKNHEQKESIWLILHKKNASTSSVSYPEAVEEALCFGWIDSKGNKLDEERFKVLFSPRKPRGVWSKVNKARIKVLTEQGLMTEAGLAKIEAAKKNGSWTTLDATEAFVMPTELEKAFLKNKKARQYFEAFPPSAKKVIFHWITAAKTEETKKKRVKETVEQAAKNIRANQYKPK